jgi:2-methylisocitrate lyase-like PEP mutase family enzyme
MTLPYGRQLRAAMAEQDILAFLGVYDVFSASVAARHADALFLSGFGLAASYYGLPDIGFIAWPDMVAFVQRVRTVLPCHHLMVDIDDGYGDAEVAAHVVTLLEAVGASGVILEDQKRPRRCGHFQGKQILELDAFLEKLTRVLATRRELVVVARTDAPSNEERLQRAVAFAEAGADAVLVDGLEDLNLLKKLRHAVDRPRMFNQIAGGKSPRCSLSELKALGVSLVNYSTPCLFAAQAAIEEALQGLKDTDGRLEDPRGSGVSVASCTAVLADNLARRDSMLSPSVLGTSAEAGVVVESL